MKNLTIPVVLFTLCLLANPLWAFGYQYISAAELKQNLEQATPLQLVDIQVEQEFAQHHLADALATYAYPVKTDQDRAKLAAILPQLKASSTPIVVICPRGGGGAKRGYDYLEAQGIDEDRLLILENGQQGWPYPQLLAH